MSESSSIINTQPQLSVVEIPTTPTATPPSLKDQLKNLSIEERYILLSAVNSEERELFMKQQQQKIKDEEDKIAQCPVSKQVHGMKIEIQDLKMELQKLKNKINVNENKLSMNTNTIRCPYSILKGKQDYLNYNSSSDYEYDLCNEMEETCSSTWSWWSIIMFVLFILIVLTSKPPKHYEDFITRM